VELGRDADGAGSLGAEGGKDRLGAARLRG
jgi:hypothetical protein